MGLSWFAQISPSLQLIHKSIVNYELEPTSKQRLKSLLSLLHSMKTSWISKESYDVGIIQHILKIILVQSIKIKRKILKDIVSVLVFSNNELPKELLVILYDYIDNCIRSTEPTCKKAIKAIKRTIKQYINTTPSCLALVVKLGISYPQLNSLLHYYFHFLILHFASTFKDETSSFYCSCSNCINKVHYRTIHHLQQTLNSMHLQTWRELLHTIPVSQMQEQVTQLAFCLVKCILEIKLPPSVFSIHILHDCIQLVGTNCLLDIIESTWNRSHDTSTCSLLSILLAHSTLLTLSETLQILVLICKEALPSYSLVLLLLHTLFIRLSNPYVLVSSDKSLLLQLVNYCNLINTNVWNQLPYVLIHFVGVYLNSNLIPLCCTRWRLHLCPKCEEDFDFLLNSTQCSICISSLSNQLTLLKWNKQKEYTIVCPWQPPSLHYCPVCKKQCGCLSSVMGDELGDKSDDKLGDKLGDMLGDKSGDKLGDKSPNTSSNTSSSSCCYCSLGIYPLSFDYSISDDDSDDSDDELESKRLCLEIQKMNEQLILTEEIINHQSRDVWLRIMTFCTIHDLIQCSQVDSIMLELCNDNSIWKQRYIQLFDDYHCTHKIHYQHNYKKMYCKRIKSLKKLKNEYICQYCNCSRRFSTVEEYQHHIQSTHNHPYYVCLYK